MVAKLRLLAALGALVTALAMVWQSAPPVTVAGPKVQLRSTAAPMDPPTTMKSPIVATTDPSPFNPCQDIPFDVVQRLGLGFTPPEPQEGLRCQYDAGNYQVAVEPIIWRTYEQSLPADAVENTVNGHRVAQYWNLKPTYHNSYWYMSCMVIFKTSYGIIQQSLFYSTVYSNPEVDCPSTNLQRANDLSPYYKF
ncbi:MAG: DUF3558 domain-containing protein [Mycobacterium sp.]|uniref:DUF3558 domain-containing protein n=1 Tax=Mycobacterium sp. TaxID=1785 RepID=UPI003C41E0A4